MSKQTIGSMLWGALTKNFWLKLISFTFALGFYAFIHGEQNGERTVAVTLLVEKPPESVQRKLMSTFPPSVDVKIVGPFEAVQRLRPDDMSIIINLEAAQSIPSLQLTRDMINGLPPRVSVERVTPSQLEIVFEQIVTKPIPVKVDFRGEPAKGMEVSGKVLIDPANVDATGIDSAVSVIQFAETADFDLTGLTKGTYPRKLKLLSPPDDVEWSVPRVEATVEIGPKMATREFSNITLEVVGLAGAQARPKVVDLVITGPPGKIEALRETAIVPRVEPRKSGEDLTTPGSAEMPIIVDIPNVQVTVTPAKAIVKW